MGTDSLMGVKLDSLNNILNQPNYKEAKFDVPRLTLFIIVAKGLVRKKGGGARPPHSKILSSLLVVFYMRFRLLAKC